MKKSTIETLQKIGIVIGILLIALLAIGIIKTILEII